MLGKKLLVRLFFINLLFCTYTLVWGQQYNTWRYHNSYETSTALETTDLAVWSASLTGLLRYDRTSGEIETYDKTNGLSDVQKNRRTSPSAAYRDPSFTWRFWKISHRIGSATPKNKSHRIGSPKKMNRIRSQHLYHSKIKHSAK